MRVLLSPAAHLGEGLGQIWFPQMKNDNPGFLSASYQKRKCGEIHISICPWIWVLSSEVWLKWNRRQSCQSRLRSLHVWVFGAKFRQIRASHETVAVWTIRACTQISIHFIKRGGRGCEFYSMGHSRCLEQIHPPVSRPQVEHVWPLAVVWSPHRQRVMDGHSVLQVVVRQLFVRSVFTLRWSGEIRELY